MRVWFVGEVEADTEDEAEHLFKQGAILVDREVTEIAYAGPRQSRWRNVRAVEVNAVPDD